ncbi:MAG: FkbM family methyltransferase [Flavobacterium sp.]|nr:FkbM family methyltransferase [Flavobacterium sp.]
MSILSYFKASFNRKKARQVFQNYGYQIDSFNVPNYGEIQYANWLNPLVTKKKIIVEEVDFFKKLINTNSLIIDIGANTGDLTVPMAVAAGEGSLILALDPNPQVFTILEANSKINKNKATIIPLLVAATEVESEFYFASSEASFSNGALITDKSDNTHGKFKLKEKVKGINLQNHLFQNYSEWIPKISLIKVDTEGHDLNVLKTLSVIIEKYKPTIIAEVFTTLSFNDRAAMFNFFKDNGYFVYDISHIDFLGGINPKILMNENDMAKPGIASNILAMENEWKF